MKMLKMASDGLCGSLSVKYRSCWGRCVISKTGLWLMRLLNESLVRVSSRGAPSRDAVGRARQARSAPSVFMTVWPFIAAEESGLCPARPEKQILVFMLVLCDLLHGARTWFRNSYLFIHMSVCVRLLMIQDPTLWRCYLDKLQQLQFID